MDKRQSSPQCSKRDVIRTLCEYNDKLKHRDWIKQRALEAAQNILNTLTAHGVIDNVQIERLRAAKTLLVDINNEITVMDSHYPELKQCQDSKKSTQPSRSSKKKSPA